VQMKKLTDFKSGTEPHPQHQEPRSSDDRTQSDSAQAETALPDDVIASARKIARLTKEKRAAVNQLLDQLLD
jgi:hypothetical protein